MKTKLLIGLFAVALAVIGYFTFFRGEEELGVEYEYAIVESGEVVRSISASGVLVPDTIIDIKSVAGGEVIQLAVEEGTEVKRGDLIAVIDPRDTQALFDQAAADVRSAQVRVRSAEEQLGLQRESLANAERNAEVALEVAQTRLERAREEAARQPAITGSDISSAQAALAAQIEALRVLEEVDAPQRRADATAARDRGRTDLTTAQQELERIQALQDRRYATQSDVDRQLSAVAGAQAAFDTATQRLNTLDTQIRRDIQAQEARVEQAEAALDRAEANGSQIDIAQLDLRAAEQAVEQAEVALERARIDRINLNLRRLDIDSAQAGAVRSNVARDNALVQLEQTTVIAPRDGVVTNKYLEEGTVIPPGTSVFSEGTSIVELADVSRMFVEVNVDEADIGNVEVGQNVRILVESYPGRPKRGRVDRIFPAAENVSGLTAVTVRVEVLQDTVDDGVILRPGLNATCEFLTLERPNVIAIPSQAVQREGERTYVRVRGDGETPIERDVVLGEQGNDSIEVVSGLEAGEEIVIAEIDLQALRELQERIEAAEEGGGLTAGGG